MRAIFIERPGGTEVLKVRETAALVPKRGELQIVVRVVGINFADILAR